MGMLEDMLKKGRAHERSSYAPFWPDEIKSGKLEPVERSISSLSSTTWDMALFPLESYRLLAPEISALSKKAVERNLFVEPSFALAGLERIEHKGVKLLGLWEQTASKRTLRLYMPVMQQYTGFPRHRVFRNYTHNFAPLGTPLVHRENTGECLETMLRLLGDPLLKFPSVLALDWLRLNEPVAAHLCQAAARLGLPVETALVYQRATLEPENEPESSNQAHFQRVLGKKRYRETRRQLRRLQELGNVTFDIASSKQAILDAIEIFLTLEAKGWKGRSGTALYSLKQIAAFSRQAIAALSAEKRCRIHTMRVENRVIAALVCFDQSGEHFTWKVAFDEEFRRYSPGVHIIMQASDHMLSLSTFKRADSLAAANHAMMNHLWRERQEVGTLLIGTGKDTFHQTRIAARAMDRQHRWKQNIKSLIKHIH